MLLAQGDNREGSALRISENCHATLWNVHGGRDYLAAKLLCTLDSLVGVGHNKIDEPMSRHIRWVHRAHRHCAGDTAAVDLPLGVLASVGHRAGLGRPGEDLQVKGCGSLHVARGELIPTEAVRCIDEFGTLHLVWLPHSKCRAGRILE